MPSDLFSNLNLNLDLFSLVKLVFGVYLLICGISGKGKVYKNDYPKIPAEKYHFIMRILNLVTGVVMLGGGILEVLNVVNTSAANPKNIVEGWIIWGLGMVLLVGMLVFNIVMTDRKKMQEELEKADRERREKAQAAREAAERERAEAMAIGQDSDVSYDNTKQPRKPDDQLTDSDLWGV